MKKYLVLICISASVLTMIWGCRKDKEVDKPADTSGTGNGPTPYFIAYPTGFPPMKIPADNPMTEEGVALGRKLFYEPMLSANNQMSCATCHKIENAFADPRKFSEGVNGEMGVRNAMPLFNLGWAMTYNPLPHKFFWDGGASDMESQVIGPITNPIEMNETLFNIVKKLQQHPQYPGLFKKAFGTDSITTQRITFALTQFERTLISGNSRYDKYKNRQGTLTQSEANGMNVFLSEEKGDCFHCHGNFSTPFFTDYQFHNNGLDSLPHDSGLARITGRIDDVGKMKVPSLRNLVYTAPYMHDGRFNTLEEVVEFYNSGTKNGYATDEFIKKHLPGGLHMSEQDKKDLVAFLKTLSDESFITNPSFMKPAP